MHVCLEVDHFNDLLTAAMFTTDNR